MPGPHEWPDWDQAAEQFETLTREVAARLERGQGLRLGEAGVLSTKVHTLDPAAPREVRIHRHLDAGQFFYGRGQSGEVIHLDIFHEVAQVDQRAVAAAVRRALGRRTSEAPRLLDYLDIQTGVGGGRASGSLIYGRKASLRHSHLNHVHLAVGWPRDHLKLVFTLAWAVETEVARQGFELRKIESLRAEEGPPNGTMDASPYSDYIDSLLKEDGAQQPPAGGSHPDPAEVQSALELAEALGGVEEARSLLEALASRESWSEMKRGFDRRGLRAEDVLENWANRGLVTPDPRGGYRLTETGWRLYDIFRRYGRELELAFRRLMQRLSARAKVKPASFSGARAPATAEWGPVRRVTSPAAGERLGQLAVAETVLAAMRRSRLEAAGRDGREPWRWSIRREDVRVIKRQGRAALDICLLVDCSASMAGRRLQAAKQLVQHLLVRGRDRVAVIAFQDRDARIVVPFTRQAGRVSAGMAGVQAQGLTPLAHGLQSAASYLRERRVKNPLLLLVTDGIPTVPCWTLNPMEDARRAAREIGNRRLPFACVGLEPNRDYLRTLAEEGRGTLYVLSELDRDTLIRAAEEERRKYLG